jgi:hypothetical protein
MPATATASIAWDNVSKTAPPSVFQQGKIISQQKKAVDGKLWMKGDLKMDQQISKKLDHDDDQQVEHVGGVNSSLGGVDPKIDENLMRLSGGP